MFFCVLVLFVLASAQKTKDEILQDLDELSVDDDQFMALHDRCMAKILPFHCKLDAKDSRERKAFYFCQFLQHLDMFKTCFAPLSRMRVSVRKLSVMQGPMNKSSTDILTGLRPAYVFNIRREIQILKAGIRNCSDCGAVLDELIQDRTSELNFLLKSLLDAHFWFLSVRLKE